MGNGVCLHVCMLILLPSSYYDFVYCRCLIPQSPPVFLIYCLLLKNKCSAPLHTNVSLYIRNSSNAC